MVLDIDWESCGIDTAEIEIERRLMRFNAEQMSCNGYSGRQLYRLFKEHEVADVSCAVFATLLNDYKLVRRFWTFDRLENEALAARCITAAELQRWRASLARADADGVFFGYACLVLVAGQK